MKILAPLYNQWEQVPAVIRTFLLWGLFLLVFWKLAYVLYWAPKGTLDIPLTTLVGTHTAGTLNALNHSEQYSAVLTQSQSRTDPNQLGPQVNAKVFYGDKPILTIANACNGLELLVLYAGFIFSYPARWQRKALFLLFGIPLVHAINIARCVGLGYLSVWRPHYFDFAHHYLFKIMIYSSILLLWWAFTSFSTSSPRHESSALA
ncbi:MAG: hypothetical protein ACKO7A_11620 [Microcystis sp.]